MRSKNRNKQGQITIEYAVVISILTLALFSSDLHKTFMSAIDSYFSDIASLVNLPIP